jgi:hypothetical protein
MSVLAQVMESVRFTEDQNKMILSGKISADRMAIYSTGLSARSNVSERY